MAFDAMPHWLFRCDKVLSGAIQDEVFSVIKYLSIYMYPSTKHKHDVEFPTAEDFAKNPIVPWKELLELLNIQLLLLTTFL